jgi:hypothetical protein
MDCELLSCFILQVHIYWIFVKLFKFQFSDQWEMLQVTLKLLTDEQLSFYCIILYYYFV